MSLETEPLNKSHTTLLVELMTVNIIVTLKYGLEVTQLDSASLKMVPFDKPYTTFCWSAIVTLALSCTISQIFNVK